MVQQFTHDIDLGTSQHKALHLGLAHRCTGHCVSSPLSTAPGPALQYCSKLTHTIPALSRRRVSSSILMPSGMAHPHPCLHSHLHCGAQSRQGLTLLNVPARKRLDRFLTFTFAIRARSTVLSLQAAQCGFPRTTSSEGLGCSHDLRPAQLTTSGIKRSSGESIMPAHMHPQSR